MVTKYQVIQDVIYNMEGLDNIISGHFKWEMFLSCEIDRNWIKHAL